MKVIPFGSDKSDKWDNFIQRCPMSTFLHTRKFLSYHQNKFVDKSFIILDDQEDWLGVFLAALNPNNTLQVISHPGLTYGGILHYGKLNGLNMINALQLIISSLKKEGFNELIYKAIPSFYYQIPAHDDLYALFRLKFKMYRRDLSSTIALTQHSMLSNKALSKMRNMMRKAEKNGIYLDTSHDEKLNLFWSLLNKNLEEKYQKRSVHSLNEIKNLLVLFPDNIQVITACINDEVLAGTVLFKTKTVIHTQYLTVNNKGKELFALDFLIQSCLNKAKEENYQFFDFGISTENEGLILNDSLLFSKTKHGSGSTIHDFYHLNLLE